VALGYNKVQLTIAAKNNFYQNQLFIIIIEWFIYISNCLMLKWELFNLSQLELKLTKHSESVASKLCITAEMSWIIMLLKKWFDMYINNFLLIL